MKNDTQSEKETCRIAHAIVELVERTNGPVTLVQVEREIAVLPNMNRLRGLM
jgi:hypothetical protein